ncbi:MAG: hypothetical protein IPK19_19790 [Chloroflexi bacterium]|nr:hypothetical protein [Chloroflexota bacterium]
MLRYVRLFLPFIVILLVAGQLSPLIARICSAQAIPWNEALEGARILGNFRHLLDPETLMAGDVFLMGTSRTTSAFAPPVLEAALAQAFPEEGSWNVVNLQTYGRYAQRAEDVLERINPDARLIVFEFSPFLFTMNRKRLSSPPISRDTGEPSKSRNYASRVRWIRCSVWRIAFFWTRPTSIAMCYRSFEIWRAARACTMYCA